MSATASNTVASPNSSQGTTLEVRQANGSCVTYPLNDAAFLVGSVPGCDLRVPGANLPPVLCMLQRTPECVLLRKLAPSAPVTINGEAVSTASLRDGDSLNVASLEIRMHDSGDGPLAGTESPAVRFAPHQDSRRGAEDREAKLNETERDLSRQAAELEKDRLHWYQHREENERLLQREKEEVKALKAELQRRLEQEAPPTLIEREQELVRRTEEIERQKSTLEVRADEIDRQREELAGMRQELADIRRQLYDRYQERRDRLSGLQEAVNRAAKKVQENKRLLESDRRDVEQCRQDFERRAEELEEKNNELTRWQQQIEDQQRSVSQQKKDFEVRDAEFRCRTEDLETAKSVYQDDLVRLDRFRGELDQREQKLHSQAAELDERQRRLQLENEKVEAHGVQFSEWHSRLTALAGQLNDQKANQEKESEELAERASRLDNQQAMLAELRSRIDQMKEEVRSAEQHNADDRARLEALEADLLDRQKQIEQARPEIDRERNSLEEERRQISDGRSVLETAVAQLHEAQEKLALAEEELHQGQQELQEKTAAQDDKTTELETKAGELQQLQQRLEADRQALAERMQLLAQAEQARETLQEQLRRRSEELSNRQRELEDSLRSSRDVCGELENRQAEFAREQQEAGERIAAQMQKIEGKAEELTKQHHEIQLREESVRNIQQKLKDQGRAIAGQRKMLQEQKDEVDDLRHQSEKAAERAREEFAQARREAVALQQSLPDLELRAGASFERLGYAREQLREHINEVHTFAAECEDNLNVARSEVQAEAERLQTREQALRRLQDEQRLSLASFRQQLIDWQGQIADVKRLLATDESRLQLRQSQVNQKAEIVDAESSRLAQQAENLHQQQIEVQTQRDEMTHHLYDMRQWYKRKLRELAGLNQNRAESTSPPDEGAVPGRDILSLTGDVDPADRKLGETLIALELIDVDTLTSLQMEARRRRCSLRQVLLADGAVTTYQMALIEMGNVDSLMLGSVRVVDRLWETPQETVYRVFDPERNRDALLRHLSEREMDDAIRPDEFRQRFTSAIISHPNLFEIHTVLEIEGRPAVLQEAPDGLPCSAWPGLAAVPGVWLELVRQAAQALSAVHQAGVVHGHLQMDDIWLTREGLLKIRGLGEPHWLAPPPGAQFSDEVNADLQALGRCAAEWADPSSGRTVKPLPKTLRKLVERMLADTSPQTFSSADDLLEAVDAAAAKIPANPEAWSQLIRYVREHATDTPLRKQTA